MDAAHIHDEATLAAFLLTHPGLVDGRALGGISAKIEAFEAVKQWREDARKMGAAAFAVEADGWGDEEGTVTLNLVCAGANGERYQASSGKDEMEAAVGEVVEGCAFFLAYGVDYDGEIAQDNEAWVRCIEGLFEGGAMLDAGIDDHALCRRIFGCDLLALAAGCDSHDAMAAPAPDETGVRGPDSPARGNTRRRAR